MRSLIGDVKARFYFLSLLRYAGGGRRGRPSNIESTASTARSLKLPTILRGSSSRLVQRFEFDTVVIQMEAIPRDQALSGCLLGTAVGDALGLPYEGLSPRRGRKLFGPPDRYHLLFGRGMVSDDTEHACMTAEAMLVSGGNVDLFVRDLARRLRWWLLCIPAGIGLATLKSIVKLWVGFSPTRSGVWSAGNGPAMRAAVIGVAAGSLQQMLDFTVASTRITHRNPKAVHGSLAVALAAHLGSRDPSVGGRIFLEQLIQLLSGQGAEHFIELMSQAVSSANSGQTTTEFASPVGSSGEFRDTSTTPSLSQSTPGSVIAEALRRRYPKSSSAAATPTPRLQLLADSSAQHSVEFRSHPISFRA